MSALLRSGDIKDYTALGQDGQAVYTVATQLRDAIRFKRGRMFADYLAVPQRNDVGSTIDWYVPFESENPDGTYYIIPWSSATDEEKEKALTEYMQTLCEAMQKKNATTVYNSMGKLVKTLNKINDKYGLIETMEREELCDWLNTLIRKTGLELADNVDITDEYREW